MWTLHLSCGKAMRFRKMVDAIAYAESNDIRNCTIEGPALNNEQIFNEVVAVEAAGFEISADCFLANFDGKVN